MWKLEEKKAMRMLKSEYNILLKKSKIKRRNGKGKT